MTPRTPKIPHGGDYNPEQWPEEVWDEDHRLFTRAGIDTLTVGVFSWSLTQPAEDTYDFTVLDRVLARHGLLGPYAGHPGLETAARVAPDGTRLLFLLNHSTEPARPTARDTVTDLLTGKRTERGEPLGLDPLGVAVLRLG